MANSIIAQAEVIGTSAANYPASTRVISINELETLLQRAQLESDELKAKLARYSVSAGEADQYKCVSAGVDEATVLCKRAEKIIAGLNGSVAVGSDGEWVSVRRYIRDEAVQAIKDLSTDLAHVFKSYCEASDRATEASAVDGFKARLVEALEQDFDTYQMQRRLAVYIDGLVGRIERGEFDTPAAGDQEAKA